MIIQLSDLGQVHLVCSKIDMRQGIDSLAYVVKTHFELDPKLHSEEAIKAFKEKYEAEELVPFRLFLEEEGLQSRAIK
ncbi:putative oxidase [Streptococcus pneumoniae]|nr:putative oxidase [Streptococcus pneumoniae]